MQIEFKNRRGNPELARITEQSELFIVRMPLISGADRVLPIIKPPAGVVEGSTPWSIVTSAVRAVVELADETAGANGDGLLSPMGINQTLAPDRRRAVEFVRTMVENAHRMKASADTALADLFAFPPVSASPVTIAADREIRDRWHDLGDDDKGMVLAEILADPIKHEQTATALARSPFPLRYGKADATIREAREASVRALRPLTVAKADLDVLGLEWATMALPAVGEVCGALCYLGRDHLFELVDGADAAPQHVLDAFGFRSASEIVALRLRRALAA